MITKLDQLIAKYKQIYYVEDTSGIPLVCASVIQSMRDSDPLWIFIVGGSSAGKTELINLVTGVKFVKQISTLTENTLLSGMKAKPGKETSLLKEMRNGVITMKDFTTILSMNNEKQQAIMAQFREMFDGHMTKATGTGEPIEWKGKINLLAGVTEAIYTEIDKFNKMGTRNLFYTMPEQDRKKTCLRAIQNIPTIKKNREELRNMFTEYILHVIETTNDKTYEVPDRIKENIIDIADFASIATTGISRNYRGEMQLALSANLPMRMAMQATDLGVVFMAMSEGEMPDWGEKIIYKTLLDSIQKQRKIVLEVLARYREVTTKAVGIALGYESDIVGGWLADLDALGIVKRTISTEAGKTRWVLKEEYRRLFTEFGGVIYRDEIYTGTKSEETYVEASEQATQDEEIDNQFKIF